MELRTVSPFRLSSLLRLQKDPELALQLFLNPNPNPNPKPKRVRYTLLSYDLIITKLGRARMFDELDEILNKLKLETRFDPTEIIFCNVITYYSRAGYLDKAIQLFDEIPSYRCRRTVKSFNSLLNGMLTCHRYAMMDKMFAGIDRFTIPDAVTYNIMINACRVRGDMDGAWKMFDKMRQRGLRPSASTFSTLICGLCANMNLKEAYKLKRDLWRVYKVKPNLCVYSSLMKALCKAKKLEAAFELKEEMLENKLHPDSMIYTTLISGLFKAGQKEEVKRILKEMKQSQCKPDTVTYNALIAGFCGDNDFDSAMRILNQIEKMGLKPDVVSYNILIRGFCNGGKIRQALDLFEDMPRRGCKPDILSYRILFDALCSGMELQEAAHILDEMIFKGYAPRSASTKEFLDRLCQKVELDLLLSVLTSLAEANLLDMSSWEAAVSTVINKDRLLNLCELLDRNDIINECSDEGIMLLLAQG